jgi:hypothetical protein
MKKNEQRLRDLWNTIKYIAIFLMEVLEGDEKEEQKKNLKK